MDPLATAQWELYRRIVDSVYPDAPEIDIVKTFDAILDVDPVPDGVDERLVTAAQTALHR